MDLGTNIKVLREAKGWTQQELGDQAGLSQRAISHIESGKRETPRKGNVEAIAGALGVSVARLYEKKPPIPYGLVANDLTGDDIEFLESLIKDRQRFHALCDLLELTEELPPEVADRLANALIQLLKPKPVPV